MKIVMIEEGNLPLQVDLFTTKKGLVKSEISVAESSFCCRFLGSPHFIEELIEWLRAYLKKKPIPLNFPLDSGCLTPFQKNSLDQVRLIPWGKRQTYGEIASKVGGKNYARAIGMVCNKNPWPLFIPCHRVIGSRGHLGGFAYGLSLKQQLLEFET